MLKARVRGIDVEVQSFDELDELIRRYGGEAVASAAIPAPDNATPATPVTATSAARRPSQDKREAMLRLYKGLKATMHKDLMKLLVAKQGRPVDTEEVREDLKLPANFKMSGFTTMVRKRAPSYGLNPDEVLAVEFRGTVAGHRLYLYALGPEMLEVLEEAGVGGSGKGGKK